MNIITNNQEQCKTALAALYDVLDPEIGLNIVDLGLLYQMDFNEEEKKIFLTMTLTTQFCPMGDSIMQATEDTLKITFPDYTPAIELSFNPPWNREMISEEGRAFLNQ